MGLYQRALVLILRATGRIIGTICYRDLEIERGGKITGTVEIIDESNADKCEKAGPAATAPHVVA
jgi:cytoskeletal protein CcmA (bactofilin family)